MATKTSTRVKPAVAARLVDSRSVIRRPCAAAGWYAARLRRPLGERTETTMDLRIHELWAVDLNCRPHRAKREPAIVGERFRLSVVLTVSWSRSGRAVIIVRAVSRSDKCDSIERLPRAALAIKSPMDDKTMPMIDNATSTSIKVNPALSGLGSVERDNFDPSGQPIDSNFVTYSQTTQGDDAATRHAGRKEGDTGAGQVCYCTAQRGARQR